MVAELTLALPRDPRYVVMARKVTRSMLGEFGVPEGVIEEVELALTEACSNAVRHAVGSSSYGVTVKADEHGCDIQVVDGGPGFSVSRDGDWTPANEHGYGLFLIDSLVDEVSFDRRAEGMAVQLWKSWPTAGAGGNPSSESAGDSGDQYVGHRHGRAT